MLDSLENLSDLWTLEPWMLSCSNSLLPSLPSLLRLQINEMIQWSDTIGSDTIGSNKMECLQSGIYGDGVMLGDGDGDADGDGDGDADGDGDGDGDVDGVMTASLIEKCSGCDVPGVCPYH